MATKYQIDGDIFLEINETWLFAYVNEYLIKARVVQTDALGNKVELLQLNDGRVFSHPIAPECDRAGVREPTTRPVLLQGAAGN